MMMKLTISVILLLIAVHQSESKRKPRPPPDVNVLCRDIKCPPGKVCRVIEKCGRKRKSQAKCIPCVPQGADDVCNENNYLRAVLTGSARSLTPLRCHMNNVYNKFECPNGSDCVEDPDTPGFGVCCYGQIVNIYKPAQVTPVSNSDPVCSYCPKGCEDGYDCKQDVFCGLLKYGCVPQEKSGMCLEPNEPEMCSSDDGRKECVHDQDCRGNLKCCNTACGGTSCMPPVEFHVYKK